VASSESDSDAALVAQAAQGDPDAYDRLFRRHYDRLFHFALRLEGNRANAEDIAQTAFVRAYESLGRLRDGQAFLKFLYRIVVNLVRDRAKSAQRKPWIGFLDLWRSQNNATEQAEPVEFADSALNPERMVVLSEEQHALLNAIADLPLEFREALILHHIQQLDLHQIADVLGIPEGTVKSRLARARQRLRAALGAWEAEA
jgi:RNA polymerase sigma-70 factor (ECF subfamily)